MANIEDYLPGGDNDPNAQAGGIDKEILDATKDQQAREKDATPDDWEERYKNLEILNSQQAQTVGEYRKVIDEYILAPTPVSEPVVEDSSPITNEDLYDNPDEAINKAIANHPAIKEAQDIKTAFVAQERSRSVSAFKESHPDFEEITNAPEFASWVQENPTRVALYRAANNWDMNSADALFSLYKAETGITKLKEEKDSADAINAASLEDSSQQLIVTDAKYSRSEFIEQKMKANQGNPEAERWINNNIAEYRLALESGNVRD